VSEQAYQTTIEVDAARDDRGRVPRRAVVPWSSEMKGLRTIADHRVEPTPSGSRVTLVLRQSGPLAGVVRLGYGRMIRRYLHLESTGLKRRAESPPIRRAEHRTFESDGHAV
jgi:hypothetical protein